MTALIEHARSSIMYEKQLLRELEALRIDVENADKKAVPSANGVPRPRIVPPLEDFSDHPPPPSAPPAGRFHRPPLSQYQTPPHTALPPGLSVPPRLHVPQSSSVPPQPPSATSITSYDSSEDHPSPTLTPAQPTQLLEPAGAGPSRQLIGPAPPAPGRRFVDGTRSMIVQSTSSSNRAPLATSSSSTPAIPTASGANQDPLQPSQSAQPPLAAAADPLGALTNAASPVKSQPAVSVDPLANLRPAQMSSSVRFPSHRPRLDPREAASKLANMF